ncbi:uncharacterized protein [Fopius arisanus]|uniref:Reverse transcriptase domain-containing protein n=1 Tax=Fopius arisanus TaxID=64838 RepID=A0A9R1U9Q1_9HYME|nr:PREDICTED: uncharacterized protein LOC105272087 [Fopius arisanus]
MKLKPPMPIPQFLDDFNCFWSDATKDKSRGRGSGGLLLAAKKPIKLELLETSHWWIFSKVYCSDANFILGLVYFPSAREFNYRYALMMLQETKSQLEVSHVGLPFIIGGDWNARVGKVTDVDESFFEGTSLTCTMDNLDVVLNERCPPTVDFMAAAGLAIVNGRTPSDSPANFTYWKFGESVNDTIWCSAARLDLIRDLRVIPDITCSDHFPLILSLWSRSPHSSPPPPVVPSSWTCSTPKIVWKAEKLQKFQTALETLVYTPFPHCLVSPEFLHSQITDAIWTAAEQSGLISSAKPRSRTVRSGLVTATHKTWFDRECVSLKLQLKAASKASFSSRFAPKDKAALTFAQKRYSAVTSAKKAAHERQLADGLANLSSPSIFWAAVSKCRPRPGLRNAGLPVSVWNEFYRDLYPPRSNEPFLLLGIEDAELDHQFTILEINKGIENLKTSKAPGSDGITNEALKALTPFWVSRMLALFNRALDLGQIPESWSNIIMSMLFENGDRLDPTNYRGIALINTTTKLFTELLRKRLEPWSEARGILPEVQHGFRRGRSCTDAIFTFLSAVHLQLRLGKREVYAVFIDFRRAFDSIPHNLLWRKLLGLGISSKIVRVLISVHSQANLQVRSRGLLSDKFEVTEGVLQGETLSPLLFLLYISDFESFFRSRGHRGFIIDGHSDILLQLFADDAVFQADSHVRLKAILSTLYEYCTYKGLGVNTSKTQILILKGAGPPKNIHPAFTMFNGTPLSIVRSYNYLGVHISSTDKSNETL